MRSAVLALLAACAPHAEPSPPPGAEAAARPELLAGGLPAPSCPAKPGNSPLRASRRAAFDFPAPGPPTPAAAPPGAANTSSGTPPPEAGCVDDAAPFEAGALRARVAYLASAELD